MDEKQHDTDGRTSDQPAAMTQTINQQPSNDTTSETVGGISDATHNNRPETPRGRYQRGRGGGVRGFSDRKGKSYFQYFNRKRHGKQQQNDNDRRVLPSDGSDQNEQKSQAKKSNGRKRFQRRPERRDKQHKWKPYHLRSWEEKKELEERETKRAEERRNQLTTLGFPQAPYNTTQFLMEDHKSEHDKMFDDEGGFLSSEESPAEDDISLDRGYAQELARVLVADLNAWSKDRLISHILQMEHEKSVLERRIRSLEKEVERLTPKMDVEDPSIDGAVGFM